MRESAQVVLRGEAAQEADTPERFHVGGRRGDAPRKVESSIPAFSK